ncbi:spermidine synthase [Alicyclobacillus sp. SP_1]|uniref:spermidine synthase n=1 Tax=Alicyclobacillus sp. SP_1 TaxID=2942475 RepID=UPI00215726CA|nr:hypothetical protein [Alicyclobacillus sp. SP_1]
MDQNNVRPPSLYIPSPDVVERRHIRYLRFGDHGGWQGALNLKHPLSPVFAYQRAFQFILESLDRPVTDFLSLGVGTGTALRSVQHQFPFATLTGVDIRQDVIQKAITLFGAPTQEQAAYFVNDAFVFLQQSKSVYDLTFVDVYLANSMHPTILRHSFLTALRERLTPNGYAIFNLIGYFPPRGPLRRFVEDSSRLFSYVHVLPVGAPLIEQNTLYILSCANHPLTLTALHTRNGSCRWKSAVERKIWSLRGRVYTKTHPFSQRR